MNFLNKKRSTYTKKEQTSNTTKSINYKLNGSKFRMLNEMLYTSKSKDAFDYFKSNKEDFEIYHSGFSSQAEKWPCNPNDIFIKELKKKQYRSKSIIDLGCGEANIAKSLLIDNPNVDIMSFDIKALNDRVTECDIKSLPLDNKSKDIGIFCLSLMGVNFIEFIIEANRVLKDNGILYVAEIESRIPNLKSFEQAFYNIGFQLRKTKDIQGYFKIFIFRKISSVKSKDNVINNYSNVLTPCMYKKR